MNRAISLGVERTLFSVESAGLYFWRMRTSFLVECLLRVWNRRVAVAKDASPWQKQALNKLDASSMETTRIREPQGPLVASSLRSERYRPRPLRLSYARSFLDSTSNLYLELGSLNRAISLGVERTLFSVESAGLYFWRMRTSFLLLRVLNRRVAVAKDASPWQKQALNKLDASSMETTRLRGPSAL